MTGLLEMRTLSRVVEDRHLSVVERAHDLSEGADEAMDGVCQLLHLAVCGVFESSLREYSSSQDCTVVHHHHHGIRCRDEGRRDGGRVNYFKVGHVRTLFLPRNGIQENGSRPTVARALTGASTAPHSQSSRSTESTGLSSKSARRGSRSTLATTSTSVNQPWRIYARRLAEVLR